LCPDAGGSTHRLGDDLDEIELFRRAVHCDLHARNLITLTAGEHDGMVEFSVSDDLAARFVVSLPRSVDEP
jgi:hypothetical protein